MPRAGWAPARLAHNTYLTAILSGKPCMSLPARLGDHSHQQALSQRAPFCSRCSAHREGMLCRGTSIACTSGRDCSRSSGTHSSKRLSTAWQQQQCGPLAAMAGPYALGCSSSSSVERTYRYRYCIYDACPLQGSSSGVSGWQCLSAECGLTVT